jgi:hypothetical protein
MTQEQWYNKLKTSFPKWFFQEEENQIALLQGIAKMFSEIETDIDNHIDETFISTAIGLFLDTHGGERSIDRLSGEFDAQYRERIRRLSNQSNKVAIKAIVDSLLMLGQCIIVEDFEGGIFCNREYFVNRAAILIDPLIENTFSIIVDKQLHAPYSFVDREYFCNRGAFVGTIYSSQYIFDLIVEAVNRAKALGTLYRIVERGE